MDEDNTEVYSEDANTDTNTPDAAGDSAVVVDAAEEFGSDLVDLLDLDSADQKRIDEVNADLDSSQGGADELSDDPQNGESNDDVEPVVREDDPHGIKERLKRQDDKYQAELQKMREEHAKQLAELRGNQEPVVNKPATVDPIADAQSIDQLEAVDADYQQLEDFCLENLDGVKDFEYVDPKDGETKVRDLDAQEVRKMMVEARKKRREIQPRAREIEQQQARIQEAMRVQAEAQTIYPEIFDRKSEGADILRAELGIDVLTALGQNPKAAMIMGDILVGYRQRMGGAKPKANKATIATDTSTEPASGEHVRKPTPSRGKNVDMIVQNALAGDQSAPAAGGGRGATSGRSAEVSRENMMASGGDESSVIASLLETLD